MKKIFSIFASSVLALSMFVSCSGDLHNDMDPAKVALIMGETKTILDDAGIIGTINDWKNKDGVANQGDALTKVDDTTYTYTFTADQENEEFSIQEDREAKWSKPRWCGALKQDEDNAVKIEPKGEAAMIYSTDPNPSHFKLSKLEVGKAYKITITIVDEDKKSLKASVNVDGDAPAANTPAPYYLDGEFVVGCDDLLVGAEKLKFDFPGTQLLFNPELDKKTSELTYTFDVTFTSKNHDWHEPGEAAIKISQPGWKNSYGKTAIKVGEDFVELESSGDNAPVSGLKDGKAYRIVIKTTPEKKVYAKVYEILQYTLTLKVTGIAKTHIGKTGVIRGTWDSWAGKWTTAWKPENETTINKVSELKHAEVVADGDAAAMIVFKEVASGVGAPDSEIVITGCGYYGSVVDDDITTADGNIKVNDNDFEIKFKLAGGGNYTAVLNVEDNTINTTKD